MFEIQGKIKVLNDTQTVGSKGFLKREFVLTTQEKYPQDVKFECTMDRVSLLDNVSVGDEIQVKFNIRGNEYQGRYYVNLQAWAVSAVGNVQSGGPVTGSTPASIPPAAPFSEDDLSGGDDDLPF